MASVDTSHEDDTALRSPPMRTYHHPSSGRATNEGWDWETDGGAVIRSKVDVSSR